MKQLLCALLSVCLLIGVVPAMANEVTDEPITIYLDFEDELPSGVTARDLTYLDGVKGRGAYFNGSNSYIQLPNNITQGVTDFTVATWVRFEYAEYTYQRIFDFGSGTGNYMFLGAAYTSGAMRYESLVSGGTKVNRDMPDRVPNGEWTHLAVVKSGDTVTLYQNGAATATLSSTFTPNDLGTTTQNYIGRSQFSNDQYLSATLDDFLFTGKALSAEEIAAQATKPTLTEEELKALIAIPNADDVRDHLNLPSEVQGATVTWTSSNEEIVTSKPKENNGFVMEPGVITRGAQDEKVTLTASVTYGDLSFDYPIEVTVKAAPIEEEKTAYIYAYFRGYVNGSATERLSIHLATSTDGLNWTDLNGNFPVLESNVGTRAVRDPYIVRSPFGDRFYLIATDLNTADGGGWTRWSMQGSKYLVVWESDDLVNWTEPRMVKFSDNNIGCAWAPESIYDEATGEYWVYAAGKDLDAAKVVDTVFLAKTRDFRTFTQPEVFVGGDGSACIDTTMIKGHDGKFYRFSKRNSSYVDMQVADSLHSTFTNVPGYQVIYGEGPAVFKMNGNSETYCLLIDDYSKFVPYITTDIASGAFTRANATMPTGSKHGIILPVSQREYDAIMQKWGSLTPDTDQTDPSLEYDFEDDSAAIFGNATYEQDSETNSRVLTLDGTSGTYMEFPANTFDRRDTFTLSMDVKSDAENSDTMAFSVGTDSSYYYYFNAAQTAYKSALTITGEKYEERAEKLGLSPQSGTWAHMALVVEPKRIAIYRNGVKIAENTAMTKTISHLGTSDLLAYLGKSFYPDKAYFKGSFDNIKLYNRALSDDEILASFEISDEDAVKEDALLLSLDQSADAITENVTLPATGAYGSTITWETSDDSVIGADGVIYPGTDEKEALLTATLTKNGATATKTFHVTILPPTESWLATADWSYRSFPAQSGEFYLSFDILPHSISDGYIGVVGSGVTPSGWNSAGIVVRIQPGGTMDARNGGAFSASTTVNYQADQTYHVRIKANTATKLYDVYVTDESGITHLLANQFAFRSDAPTSPSFDKVVVRGGNGIAGGLFTVRGFAIDNGLAQLRGARVADGTARCSVIACSAGSYDLYVATYDAENRLVSLDKQTANFQFGQPAVFDAVTGEGGTAKFMLWNIGSMEPAAQAKTKLVL